MDSKDSAGDTSHTQVAADILCEFLEVAIHSVLYIRELYPAGIFERQKKYNVPVQISCHPELNTYICELIGSMKKVLEKGDADKVAIVVLGKDQEPLERFIFEIASPDKRKDGSDTYLYRLEQSLRSFLLKLNVCDSLLTENPAGCTWTVQLYTKQSVHLDLQQSQLIQDFSWVEADKSQTEVKNAKLVPMKALDSEIMKMQLYVEESGTKT